MERFVCALCCGPKVGAALQSCHHANDQLWRADLLLAENTHIREERRQIASILSLPRCAKTGTSIRKWAFSRHGVALIQTWRGILGFLGFGVAPALLYNSGPGAGGESRWRSRSPRSLHVRFPAYDNAIMGSQVNFCVWAPRQSFAGIHVHLSPSRRHFHLNVSMKR
jgi:hypothetical protein